MSSDSGHIHFKNADYALLGVMLSGSMAIGVYFSVAGNRQRTQEDYLLGGRRMKALPVCLSLFASFESAIALLGLPNEVYSYGTMYTYYIIGSSLSALLAPITIVPLMYPLKLTSIYQYLAVRYQSRIVQVFSAMIGTISGLSYMTMALLSPALALETAVGIPLWLSLIVVGAVGTIYTTIGGIKSVIWTDVFQSVFIFAGIFTVLVKGSMDAGGLSKVWSINKDAGRIVFDDISIDPRVRHTVWNLSFGIIVFCHGGLFSQTSFQRTVSTYSIREANKVYLFSIPLKATFIFVLVMTGLVLKAYFHAVGCDPLAAEYITNSNQLVPYFVLHTLRFLPGLAGLYISTIFSGALSTLSSGINSLAANTVHDFLSYFLHNKSEFVVTSITKLIVCFYGSAVIGLAYLVKDFQGPVSQMTYTALGATTGPLFGLFILSATFPQANYMGAMFGFCFGVVAGFWQAVGALWFGNPTKSLPRGPVHHCFAENFTSNNVSFATTEPSVTFNSTVQTESLLTLKHTTSSTVYFTNVMNTSGLSSRKFSIYDLSYVWNPWIGFLVTVLLGLIISIITDKLMSRKLRPEAKFLFPFCRRFWYSDMNVVSRDVDVKLNSFKLEK